MKAYLAILLISLASLGGLFFQHYAAFNDGKLHVVFCDVGQGDAIHIRTPKGYDILIDAGPSDKVLNCLSKTMPFWDRTIDIALMTHPHLDHFAGFTPVLERYNVLFFYTEKLSNDTASYESLIDTIARKKIALKYVYQGDSFKTPDGVEFRILSPSQRFLKDTSPYGQIKESSEFASLITLLSYKSFDTLFTGDSQTQAMNQAVGQAAQVSIEVLQVPHHGSKTGLNNGLVRKIKPELAVISVGKKNRYGHPAREILQILKDSQTKILRTDRQGTIEIVSGGGKFLVK